MIRSWIILSSLLLLYVCSDDSLISYNFFSVLDNKEYTLPPNKTENVLSIRQCVFRCTADRSCNMYNFRNGVCRLFYSIFAGDKFLVTQSGSYFGEKQVNPACEVVITGHPNRTAPLGARCIFPFSDSGVMRNKCTQNDSSTGAWCRIEGGVKYGYCHYRKLTIKTYSGTGNNASCHFPYIHNGVPKYYCYYGEGGEWCGTTADYDTDGKWGYCILPECTAGYP